MIVDKNVKVFIVHIIFFNLSLMLIYLAWKIQITLLLTKEAIVINKYLDFKNLFLKKIRSRTT